MTRIFKKIECSYLPVDMPGIGNQQIGLYVCRNIKQFVTTPSKNVTWAGFSGGIGMKLTLWLTCLIGAEGKGEDLRMDERMCSAAFVSSHVPFPTSNPFSRASVSKCYTMHAFIQERSTFYRLTYIPITKTIEWHILSSRQVLLNTRTFARQEAEITLQHISGILKKF